MPIPQAQDGVPNTAQSHTSVLPIADMMDILRFIARAEPIDTLLQKVTNTISDSFGISRMTICVLDERTGTFTPRAIHGYPPDRVLAIRRHSYTVERKRNELRDDFRVGRNSYYVRTEDKDFSFDDDLDFVLDPAAITKPRESPRHWHELDCIYLLMTDRLGNWIGWIEIDDSKDGMVPPAETVDRIQMLADLTSIAIENAKMYEEAINAMNESQGYLDLIVHDIGNLVNPLLYYLGTAQEEAVLDSKTNDRLKKAAAVASATKSLVDSVRKLSEAKCSEFSYKDRHDLREVIVRCISNARRDFPSKDIVVSVDCPETESTVLADDLIDDLFTNVLNNAVKYTPKSVAEIEVSIQDAHSAWTVRIADHGIGIPDDKKGQVFTRFAKRPQGVDGTGLGLSIVALLAGRYNGIVTVKDRVPGDHTEGASFEISLPKAPPVIDGRHSSGEVAAMSGTYGSI